MRASDWKRKDSHVLHKRERLQPWDKEGRSALLPRDTRSGGKEAAADQARRHPEQVLLPNTEAICFVSASLGQRGRRFRKSFGISRITVPAPEALPVPVQWPLDEPAH